MYVCISAGRGMWAACGVGLVQMSRCVFCNRTTSISSMVHGTWMACDLDLERAAAGAAPREQWG